MAISSTLTERELSRVSYGLRCDLRRLEEETAQLGASELTRLLRWTNPRASGPESKAAFVAAYQNFNQEYPYQWVPEHQRSFYGETRLYYTKRSTRFDELRELKLIKLILEHRTIGEGGSIYERYLRMLIEKQALESILQSLDDWNWSLGCRSSGALVDFQLTAKRVLEYMSPRMQRMALGYWLNSAANRQRYTEFFECVLGDLGTGHFRAVIEAIEEDYLTPAEKTWLLALI